VKKEEEGQHAGGKEGGKPLLSAELSLGPVEQKEKAVSAMVRKKNLYEPRVEHMGGSEYPGLLEHGKGDTKEVEGNYVEAECRFA